MPRGQFAAAAGGRLVRVRGSVVSAMAGHAALIGHV
jgi:hypothetical protein